MPGHIGFQRIDSWLRAPRSMWLSTVRPGPRPHLVPVWFHWNGRSLYFSTNVSTVKHRNLSLVPFVSCHVGDGDDPVIIEGRAAVVDDPSERSEVDSAFRSKYIDPHSGATAGYPESDQHVPYRIDIDRIMIWEYGTVTTRTDYVLVDGEWSRSGPSEPTAPHV